MTTNQSQYEEMCEVYERYNKGDLVPVVRCNDCKYLGILNEKRIYAICNKHGKVFYLWGEDAREHYCSWGERKDDNKQGSNSDEQTPVVSGSDEGVGL